MTLNHRERIFHLLLVEYGRILQRELMKHPSTLDRPMRDGRSYRAFLETQLAETESITGPVRSGPSILESIYVRFVDKSVLPAQDFDTVTAKNYILAIRSRMEAIQAHDEQEEERRIRQSVDIMMRVVNSANTTFTEFNLRENAVRIELLLSLKKELGEEAAIYKEARSMMDRHSLILINYMHELFLDRLKGALEAEQKLREELEKKRQQTEQELRMAQKIQESLLPARFPEDASLRFAARYLPMSSVGGDFYDAQSISLADQSTGVGVIIADASGHGVPAAFIAAMTKMIWPGSFAGDSDPARALTRMNDSLYERISGNFITVSLGFFQPLDQPPQSLAPSKRGVFHFANGGHQPPVLLRKGESPSLLEAKGRIVGIFPEMSVEARCIDYQAGDRFVFYTDGLVEARKNSGEMLGDESVIAYMDSLRNLPPDEFCDRLIGYVRESTSNCAQDDDVTLFVIDVV